MAKKAQARPKTAKPSKSKPGKGSAAASSKSVKKSQPLKSAAGKSAVKSAAAKPVAKTAAAKPTSKPAPKSAAKPPAKNAAAKVGGKPSPSKAAGASTAPPKSTAQKPGPPKPGGGKAAPAKVEPAKATAKAGAKGPAKPGVPAAAGGADDGKGARKGITIVSNKPRRSGPKQPKIMIPKMEPLLGPGSPFRKPLIASGPGAARKTLEIDPEALAKLKTPFNKRELQRYRDILLKKRADLVGDVSDLESEALLGRSGSLSALPQHIAEQGSETYEQSLSLNLAAEDRRLIREIDAALQRIEKLTFGICEMTGKPISRDRLEELPWTRYSIEAAREFERRTMGR